MMVLPEMKDLWSRTESLTPLLNAVNGIYAAIDLLIHKSIVSADRVKASFLKPLNPYTNKKKKEYTDHMANVFVIRMQNQL